MNSKSEKRLAEIRDDASRFDGRCRRAVHDLLAMLDASTKRAEEAEAKLSALREAASSYREVAEAPPGNLDTVQDVARDALDAALADSDASASRAKRETRANELRRAADVQALHDHIVSEAERLNVPRNG